MKRSFAKWMFAPMALLVFLLLTGCGEKTCHFVAPDSGGLEPGASVEWYNAIIGSVTAVQAEGGAVRVNIAFDSVHAKSVHDGVIALIVDDPSRAPKPFVVLRGGQDEARPLLQDGVRIPFLKPGNAVEEGAMRFGDWLTGKREAELAFLAVLIVALALFGKCLGAFVVNLLRIAVLAMLLYVAWSFYSDWDSHRERFGDLKAKAEEAAEWLMQRAESGKAPVAPPVEE